MKSHFFLFCKAALPPVGFILAALCMLTPLGRADSLSTSVQINGQPCASSTTGASSCADGAISANAMASLQPALNMDTSAVVASFEDPVGTAGASAMANADLIYDFTGLLGGGNGTVQFSFSTSSESSTFCSAGPGFCLSKEAFTQIELSPNSIPVDEQFVGLGAGSDGITLQNGVTDLTVSTDVKNGGTNLSLLLTSYVDCNVSFGAVCGGSSEDPLTLTGVEVFDSSGNLVPDASVISDSGVNFTASPVATPEPPSLLMLGFGLATLCGMAFCRKRQRNLEALAR